MKTCYPVKCITIKNAEDSFRNFVAHVVWKIEYCYTRLHICGAMSRGCKNTIFMYFAVSAKTNGERKM